MKTTLLLLTVLVYCFSSLHAQEKFDARQFTSSPAREGFPSFSPDGKYMVCQRTDRHDTLGHNGLWKFPLDDVSGAKQILQGIAEHPKWSPDGLHIVFDADTGKSIKMMPANGGEPKAFLPDSIQIMNGGLPCWSPDATQIAFIEGSSISLCIYDLVTGKLTRIFAEEGMLPLPGGWSGDGTHVLIALMDRQTRKSTIWMISRDGKEREQITGHHENFYRHLALSPDGSLLVYAALENGFLGLFIMLAEGGNSLPLAVSDKGHNDGPCWSPDGKMVAYSSGNGDIWIVDLDSDQIVKKLQALNE